MKLYNEDKLEILKAATLKLEYKIKKKSSDFCGKQEQKFHVD